MAINLDSYFYHGFFVFLLITVITCSVIATRLMISRFKSKSIVFFNFFFYLGVIGFAWLWIQNIFGLPSDFRPSVIIYILSMVLLQLSIYNHDEKCRFNRLMIGHGAIFSVFVLFTNDINQLALVEACFTLTVLPALIYFTFTRALHKSNIGNTVLLAAQCILLLVPITQLTIITHSHNLLTLYSLTVIAHATVFVMTGLGLITTLLIDEKRRYAELSLKDPLTNLYNRRGLQYILEKRQLLTNQHAAFLYASALDIDFFKSINDNYGHEAGDLVLEVFAELLQHHLHHEDLCCRLGGEEFLILSVEKSPEQAYQKLEELRQIIESSQIEYKGQIIAFTASFGLTHWQQADTFDDLINRADKALYSAKNNGRNRIETIL
ncbi:GGDEF domain-containing protein [Pseudoalteromonas sp. 68 DY56-GL68]|uniref:GGDEF domain-containing protein n=1 Tax=Pseudoalteromonas sp. 68 DY56-GL68 TaxID=2974919 RepID=UPI00352A0580